MRRVLLGILLLLPALVLAGWLFAEQSPMLFSPQWWWISASSPDGAPAACEAASSLNVYQGQRLLFQQPAISAEEAKASADRLIVEHYTTGDDRAPAATLEYGGPALFSAVFEGQRRLVWLYTARVMTSHVSALPGSEMPGAAALVYLDADTGDILALLSAAGAGNAAAMCPFPLRDWAVAAVRSTPLMALVGYVGLLVTLGVVWMALRLLRKTRAKRQNTV